MYCVNNVTLIFRLLAAEDGQLCDGITKPGFSKSKMNQTSTSHYTKISGLRSDLAAGIYQAMLWSCNETLQSTLHLHTVIL